METEKLYDNDPMLTTFTAVVTACEPVKNGFAIALDRTAFYPEGGGQPCDFGVLGDLRVTDVQEKNGVISHFCADSLPVGSTVTGTIDWDRRFDHMQCHSGEHIFSGILCARYHCGNTGFHMGRDCITIDFDQEFTWEQLVGVQDSANAAIWADLPVETSYPSAETLATLNYRCKKSLDAIRLVTFPGVDCCGCCGTHVIHTGQVGLVKLLSHTKFRNGTRIEILCGQRAFSYLNQLFLENRNTAQLLSAKPTEITQAAARMDAALTAAKEQIAKLENTVFTQIAKEYQDKGQVVLFHDDLSPDGLRRLCTAVAQSSTGMTAVFSGDADRYGYAICHPQGEDISAFVRSLNAVLNGRGGGKSGFAQGSVSASKEEIEAFFNN